MTALDNLAVELVLQNVLDGSPVERVSLIFSKVFLFLFTRVELVNKGND